MIIISEHYPHKSRGGAVGPGEVSRSCHTDPEVEDVELDRDDSTLRRRGLEGVALKGRTQETWARQRLFFSNPRTRTANKTRPNSLIVTAVTVKGVSVTVKVVTVKG